MDRFTSNLINGVYRQKVSFGLKVLSTIAESDFASNLGACQRYAVLEVIGVSKGLNNVLVSYAIIDRQTRVAADRYSSIINGSTELSVEAARRLNDPVTSFRRFKNLLTANEGI